MIAIAYADAPGQPVELQRGYDGLHGVDDWVFDFGHTRPRNAQGMVFFDGTTLPISLKTKRRSGDSRRLTVCGIVSTGSAQPSTKFSAQGSFKTITDGPQWTTESRTTGKDEGPRRSGIRRRAAPTSHRNVSLGRILIVMRVTARLCRFEYKLARAVN